MLIPVTTPHIYSLCEFFKSFNKIHKTSEVQTAEYMTRLINLIHVIFSANVRSFNQLIDFSVGKNYSFN